MMMVVVNIPTSKEFEYVVRLIFDHYKRMRWGSGNRFINMDYWREYESETCIFIEDNEMTYCNRNFVYRSYKGINILDVEQFCEHVKGGSIKLFEKVDLGWEEKLLKRRE